MRTALTRSLRNRLDLKTFGLLLVASFAAGCVVDPAQSDAGGQTDAVAPGTDGGVARPDAGPRADLAAPGFDAEPGDAELDAGGPINRCDLPIPDLGPTADEGPGPDVDATTEPDEGPPLDPPTPDCNAACAPALAGRQCLAACSGLRQVLEPAAFEAWTACMGAQPQQGETGPNPVRTCLAALDCGAVPELVGQQCDALGRCGSEGRGYFDEAACRAAPYEETRIWACMPRARRDRVAECLYGSTCTDLQQCLDYAACDADQGCLGVVHTALAIDCPRICGEVWEQCYSAWGSCMTDCREAARVLPAAALGTLERCALEPENQCQGRGVIRLCADTLECAQGEGGGALFNALRDRAATCNVPHLTAVGQQRGWNCLGEVHQARLRACLEPAVACEDIEACLDRAECGANPGCMDFMAP